VDDCNTILRLELKAHIDLRRPRDADDTHVIEQGCIEESRTFIQGNSLMPFKAGEWRPQHDGLTGEGE
jgi:hypothetical protein